MIVFYSILIGSILSLSDTSEEKWRMNTKFLERNVIFVNNIKADIFFAAYGSYYLFFLERKNNIYSAHFYVSQFFSMVHKIVQYLDLILYFLNDKYL